MEEKRDSMGTKILTPGGKDYRKCPKHNQWKRKGECPMCEYEKLIKRQAVEKQREKDVRGY